MSFLEYQGDQYPSLKWNNMCESYSDEISSLSWRSTFYSLSIDFFQVTFACTCASLIFFSLAIPTMHYFLLRLLPKYKNYSQGVQLVMTGNILKACTHFISMGPYTWVIVMLMFGNSMYVLQNYLWVLLGIGIANIALEIYECVYRAIVKPSLELWLHHIIQMCFVLMFSLKPTVFLVQIIALVGWSSTFQSVREFGHIFYVLFKGERVQLIKFTLAAGIAFYITSRIVVFVILFSLISCTNSTKDASFYVASSFAVYFALLQCYSIRGFVYMYKNAGKSVDSSQQLQQSTNEQNV
eukprot:TRINITY_DN10621_c0_g3_i2.p1 TRINITY_DN10621_c0_g3~~TRINITY_DN10621_c0_g3_i2.p1  ORF type:complete len:296 (-),score=4.98 TRINITY_DN10621_c0_g3_i2:1142-2029(-)